MATQLATNRRQKDRLTKWPETVLAIAEHDDAENEVDGEELRTSTGGPLNFSMETFELAHCQKLAPHSLLKGRYIVLLISLHLQFVYDPFVKSDETAKVFFEEQQDLQVKWRKDLCVNKEMVLHIYNLLERCDVLSLLLCKGEIPLAKRRIEISIGPDKNTFYLSQLTEGILVAEPWPFSQSCFEVQFQSRHISQLQFSSCARFREAFLATPVSETHWSLKKRNTKKKTTKITRGIDRFQLNTCTWMKLISCKGSIIPLCCRPHSKKQAPSHA